MRRAYESGTSQNVMLHTIRLGPDLWRQYTVRFDPGQWNRETPPQQGYDVETRFFPQNLVSGQRGGESPPQQGYDVEPKFFPQNLVSGQGTEGSPSPQGYGEVTVRIGPLVNTGQVPLPGSEPPRATEARANIGAPLVHTYDEEIKIDIFSGPSFRFERQGDRLHVHFLDWHRRWSHSLTLAAALGLETTGIAALIESASRPSPTQTPLWAGLVVGLSFAAHILEDQLGFMGSNLFYPFTRRRTAGLRLFRSGDAVPNFLTVWTAAALILLNLDRFSALPRLDPWWFLGLAVVLPLAVLGGLYVWQRRRAESDAEESLQQRDIISETGGGTIVRWQFRGLAQSSRSSCPTQPRQGEMWPYPLTWDRCPRLGRGDGPSPSQSRLQQARVEHPHPSMADRRCVEHNARHLP